jgi:hypothetical protein
MFIVRDLIPDGILSDHKYQAKDPGHRKDLLNHEEDPNPGFEAHKSEGKKLAFLTGLQMAYSLIRG